MNDIIVKPKNIAQIKAQKGILKSMEIKFDV